ncbi:S8 family serine peptidase [Actinomadura miaoliensis]|uniref:Peptidase S8/S53 domain-containing protein n=1 Tax=Actinomadura miaoliensis TaxID=430685 RepID=A0ABP7VCZ8_9ACTN
MSHAGRRLPARLGATLSALTLAAVFAVPVRPAGAAAVAGTDQIRARQWHLTALRVPRVWRTSKGGGVTVAVLDTGVDRRHPDLVGRVTAGPDLTGGLRRPGSRYWGLHGTSMASIIAGHGHGPDGAQGVMGVAPQARILSVRVTWENDDPLRQGGGQLGGRNRDAVAQGIRYAVDQGADIINMSLGGGKLFYDGSSTEENAIRYALNKGVVLIASAGNDGSGANRKNFPAAYPGVIAVGAVDRRMRIWKDSNRHSYVAVCAPGVDIVSADASSGYVVGTGTSPSSAIVAGVAALIRARYPKLTPQQVRQALVEGSVPREQPGGVTTCSTTLDAVRAMTVAAGISRSGDPGATPAPSAGPVEPDGALEEEGTGIMLPAILVGGGVLVAAGVLLGWLQRRRPEDDFEDDPEDDSPYDVLRPKHPPEPVGAQAGDPSGIPVAPVNAPLWQSNEVFPGGRPPMTHMAPPPPPPEAESRPVPEPAPEPWPEPEPWPAPAPEPQPEPEQQWQLRPFVPEEFTGNWHGGVTGVNGSGTAPAEPPEGHRLDGLNGFHGKANGVDPYGEPPRQADEPMIDDEAWERFRRSVLDDGPYSTGDPYSTALPPLPRQGDTPEAPPDNATDELPAVAFPSAPPPGLDDTSPPPGKFISPPGMDDDPLGRPSRKQRPPDEDDYRPPWW